MDFSSDAVTSFVDSENSSRNSTCRRVVQGRHEATRKILSTGVSSPNVGFQCLSILKHGEISMKNRKSGVHYMIVLLLLESFCRKAAWDTWHLYGSKCVQVNIRHRSSRLECSYIARAI